MINRLGFVKKNEGKEEEEDGQTFYVLPQAFKSEICKGLDATAAAKALLNIGALTPGEPGKLQSKPRLPGMGPTRCYIINGSRLFDDKGREAPHE